METHSLRVWRQIREMTVDDLAKRTELHPVTIRNHETGYNVIGTQSLMAYAYALGIKVEQIEKPKRKG